MQQTQVIVYDSEEKDERTCWARMLVLIPFVDVRVGVLVVGVALGVTLGTAVGVTVGARVGFTVVMNDDAVVGRYIAPLILPTDMKTIRNFPKLYDPTPEAGSHPGAA